MEATAASEVRERGEITIPKKIRESFHLDPGQRVEFIPLGSHGVLMTSKRLELEDARRAIQRILRQTKASPKKVLKGLKTAREEIYEKHYGSKGR